jgi:hypothetical protein
MKNYRSMLTPMVMDLKKMNEDSSELGKIDQHLYRQADWIIDVSGYHQT